MITKVGSGKLQMLRLPYANESLGVQIFLHEVGLSISFTSMRTRVGNKSKQCGFARRITAEEDSQKNWGVEGPLEIV